MADESDSLSSVTDTETVAIAAKARGLQAEIGLTQAEIASILGIERKAVGARMSGQVPFTGPELLRLATALDRPISAFFPQETRAS